MLRDLLIATGIVKPAGYVKSKAVKSDAPSPDASPKLGYTVTIKLYDGVFKYQVYVQSPDGHYLDWDGKPSRYTYRSSAADSTDTMIGAKYVARRTIRKHKRWLRRDKRTEITKVYR